MFLIGELKDWDTILDLKSKRVSQIINNDNVFELSIFDNPQVLYIIPVSFFHAIATMQKPLNQFFQLVEAVNYHRSVLLYT